MDRLTSPNGLLINEPLLQSGMEEHLWDGVYNKDILEEAVERLTQYEDTGLSPEEIRELIEQKQTTAEAIRMTVWDECRKRNKTPGEIVTLLERAEPKMVHQSEDDKEFSMFECPECGDAVAYMNEPDEFKYCISCGQALDWSEED